MPSATVHQCFGVLSLSAFGVLVCWRHAVPLLGEHQLQGAQVSSMTLVMLAALPLSRTSQPWQEARSELAQWAALASLRDGERAWAMGPPAKIHPVDMVTSSKEAM